MVLVVANNLEHQLTLDHQPQTNNSDNPDLEVHMVVASAAKAVSAVHKAMLTQDHRLQTNNSDKADLDVKSW